MILKRLGNKQAIAHKITPYFPPHSVYIEPFFGAGGMFFNKPKVQYTIVNDLDSDVYNLYMVLLNQKEELENALSLMPVHSDLLKYWKNNIENEPIQKALRFLFISNLCVPFTQDIHRSVFSNKKEITFAEIKETYKNLISTNIRFFNEDFRGFLKNMNWLENRPNQRVSTFIYNDPPYLGTGVNYEGFTEQDSFDLFEANEATKCKWAMSEFDNPFIINQAKERGLNIINIGERRNLKNRRTEILITNYKTENSFNF